MLNGSSNTNRKTQFLLPAAPRPDRGLVCRAWVKAAAIEKDGSFKLVLSNLKKGQWYEYKAVVASNRVEISGDEKVRQQ